VTDYWFARYKPGLPQNASRGLVVLRWQGRAVIAAFALSFVCGVGCFVLGMLQNQVALGIGLWVVFVIAGASLFIWASVAKTDPAKPASEYLAGRLAERAAARPST
jgi:protein-S-isoprenylcysteine O-methyltransferase Ste14